MVVIVILTIFHQCGISKKINVLSKYCEYSEYHGEELKLYEEVYQILTLIYSMTPSIAAGG